MKRVMMVLTTTLITATGAWALDCTKPQKSLTLQEECNEKLRQSTQELDETMEQINKLMKKLEKIDNELRLQIYMRTRKGVNI